MKKMKKNTLLNKIFILSLSAVIGMSILAGCQSKSTAAAKQGTTKGQRQNGQFNAADMKKKMEENINALVADGTINQSQADKIIEALTANPQGFGGNGQRNKQNGQQNNSQNNGQSGQNSQQSNGQNPQQNNGQGNQNNNGQNRQNRLGNNALNQLVTDGVITQAQADAVMQKIRGNFNRNQNNQNYQNNQNNQNNSNGNKTT